MPAVGHVAAQHLDRALLDRARPGEQREQAGLADTVRADQRHHSAGRDLEVDPCKRQRLAVMEREPRHPGSGGMVARRRLRRSEEHTSELQSLMRTSYAVFCLKKK